MAKAALLPFHRGKVPKANTFKGLIQLSSKSGEANPRSQSWGENVHKNLKPLKIAV